MVPKRRRMWGLALAREWTGRKDTDKRARGKDRLLNDVRGDGQVDVLPASTYTILGAKCMLIHSWQPCDTRRPRVVDDRLLMLEGVGQLDPDVEAIIRAEERRQQDRLILIPSESLTPKAVREALASPFTSIYAEGYPPRRMGLQSARRLMDQEEQLSFHRRYGDRRFYKGTEFADMIESLAQRRVAEVFATDRSPQGGPKVTPEQIMANVQPLSGAAANNAVYEALLQPGDTIMGMALTHGGHLTHGSPVNRSGKYYRVVSYGVNTMTGRIDYDEMAALASEHRPNMIIAGATAYPWHIDWKRLREIADTVPGGAYLLADISHTAGLVAAGLFPNPVGYAHVTTFTTHKTLLGPRAAVILTTDRDLADRIDRAVFPGEQGGPHMHQIAAMAVALRLAQSDAFRQTQRRIVDNAVAVAHALQRRGIALACGGTETHLLLVDLNSLKNGRHPLKGDVAARILDICGLVCNRNTIPGDVSAGQASGIRLGTVWVTQRGFGPEHMEQIAALIHKVLTSIRPFTYVGTRGLLARGKTDFDVVREVRREVAELVQWAEARQGNLVPREKTGESRVRQRAFLEILGDRAGMFLQSACAGQVLDLAPGQRRALTLLDPRGEVLATGDMWRAEDDPFRRRRYILAVQDERRDIVKDWLEALSDGYIQFDPDDVLAKIDGPVVVRHISAAEASKINLEQEVTPEPQATAVMVEETKPYFVGQRRYVTGRQRESKPEHSFVDEEGQHARRSCLYDEHVKLNRGRNMASFAGWTMPLWYTGISDEYHAVRETAALFDVTHMGVMEISGPGAARFLDLVTTNYVPGLEPGQAHYSYILDPDGQVIDDIFLYRRTADRFMLVANAANAERVQSWLEAVNAQRCLIDRQNPAMAVDATATIRNLKDSSCDAESLVDLALQGPHALAILQSIADPAMACHLSQLAKSEFIEGALAGVKVLISRTGYTGEEIGFELYLHPDQAPVMWRLLLEQGAAHGLKPAGLGARDAARIEAGFPLYGHEIAGPHSVSPLGAGYGAFVKFHKPFFVGRTSLLAAEACRRQKIARFVLDSHGGRPVRAGDPVVNRRGWCIGHVTSATTAGDRQVGMAYLDAAFGEPDTPIVVYPTPRGSHGSPPNNVAELRVGEQIILPETGRVVSRFMKG